MLQSDSHATWELAPANAGNNSPYTACHCRQHYHHRGAVPMICAEIIRILFICLFVFLHKNSCCDFRKKPRIRTATILWPLDLRLAWQIVFVYIDADFILMHSVGSCTRRKKRSVSRWARLQRSTPHKSLWTTIHGSSPEASRFLWSLAWWTSNQTLIGDEYVMYLFYKLHIMWHVNILGELICLQLI